MAISHICIGCGFDLARHRTLIEPHYGLPLVTCSRCGLSAVRRRHPIQHYWRAFLRLKKAAVIGAVQVFVLLVLAGFTIVTAHAHTDLVVVRRFALLDGTEWVLVILGLVALPLATGAWLDATLGHWPFRTQWIAWAGFVLVPGWILPAVVAMLDRAQYGGADWMRWSEWFCALIIYAVMWLISFAGLPVAAACRNAARMSAQQRWRKRRTRLRRWRTTS